MSDDRRYGLDDAVEWSASKRPTDADTEAGRGEGRMLEEIIADGDFDAIPNDLLWREMSRLANEMVWQEEAELLREAARRLRESDPGGDRTVLDMADQLASRTEWLINEFKPGVLEREKEIIESAERALEYYREARAAPTDEAPEGEGGTVARGEMVDTIRGHLPATKYAYTSADKTWDDVAEDIADDLLRRLLQGERSEPGTMQVKPDAPLPDDCTCRGVVRTPEGGLLVVASETWCPVHKLRRTTTPDPPAVVKTERDPFVADESPDPWEGHPGSPPVEEGERREDCDHDWQKIHERKGNGGRTTVTGWKCFECEDTRQEQWDD